MFKFSALTKNFRFGIGKHLENLTVTNQRRLVSTLLPFNPNGIINDTSFQTKWHSPAA